MAEPIEYTFWGYWGRIIMKIPRLLYHSWRKWFLFIGFCLFFATLFNKQIGESLIEQWKGISPWWSFIFIIVLLIWGLMNAIYEERQDLYFIYKETKTQLDQILKELHKDEIFMPLKEAIQQLCNKRSERPLFDNWVNKQILSHKPQPIWIVLGDHFVYNTNIMIYGKDRYSTELREIKKEELGGLCFDNEMFSVHNAGDTEPQYIHISVKRDEVGKAIEQIINIAETRRPHNV